MKRIRYLSLKEICKPKYLLLLVPIIYFIVYGMLHFGIYFSDTNGYFYTAYSILQGKILYKDIFFTNLPLYPYIAVLYFILLKGNLYAFYFVQIIEVITSACLIYYIVFKQTQNILITTLCGAAYLMSMYVFISGGFGINTAILFILFAYIFLQNKRFILTGVFLALCFLTKAYFVPVILGFFLSLLFERRFKKLFQVCISFSLVCAIVLLPFILFYFHNFWFDLFQYAVGKNGTFNKTGILGTFIFYESLFFFVSLLSIVFIKKHTFFALMSICFYSYFVLAHTVYSYHFNMLLPFMAIYLSKPLDYLQKLPEMGKMTIPALMICYFVYAAVIARPFNDLGKIEHFDDMIQIIVKEKPKYIYGTSFVTPAFAYLTNTPLLNNLIDTDEALFSSGVLDNKKLTKEAIAKKSMIIVWGTEVNKDVLSPTNTLSNVIDRELLIRNCHLRASFPMNAGKGINSLLMFKCY